MQKIAPQTNICGAMVSLLFLVPAEGAGEQGDPLVGHGQETAVQGGFTD